MAPVVPGATLADQAEYLTHIRADSIVRDLELIRTELGVQQWSLLGQSFGGFTSLTHLSLAPDDALTGDLLGAEHVLAWM